MEATLARCTSEAAAGHRTGVSHFNMRDYLSNLPEALLRKIAINLLFKDYANLQRCRKSLRHVLDVPDCWEACVENSHPDIPDCDWGARAPRHLRTLCPAIRAGRNGPSDPFVIRRILGRFLAPTPAASCNLTPRIS